MTVDMGTTITNFWIFFLLWGGLIGITMKTNWYQRILIMTRSWLIQKYFLTTTGTPENNIHPLGEVYKGETVFN